MDSSIPFLRSLLLIVLLGTLNTFSFQAIAQSTTLNSTIGSTGYTGNNGSGNNGSISFVVANNSSGAIVLTDVGNWTTTAHNGTTSTLWYSTTSLSGFPGALTNPTWTQVVSATVNGITATGVNPVITGMNFQIPAGATYRFALHTTGFNWYSGFGAGTASPNNFNGAGVTLYTGDHQISGGNVGYGQGNNPRFFTGFITFKPAAVPCVDTIDSAKIFGPTEVCPNKPFSLQVGVNSSLAISGLVHNWEFSDDRGRTWKPFPGTPSSTAGGSIVDSILAPRWYRNGIRCTTNNRTIVTPIHKVDIAPFYYCYCNHAVTSTNGPDIGNIVVMENTPTEDTVIDKGVGLPTYNNKESNRVYTSYHDSLGGFPCVYRDTSYKFQMMQIHSGGTFVNGVFQIYLDMDRDGRYHPTNERIGVKAVDGLGATPTIISVDYTIPSTASVGPTGLRFVLSTDTLDVEPCDTVNGLGEVEDYIVDICYKPCDSPVNAGIVQASDTSMCVGYDYVMTDTTYQKNVSGYTWNWQVSGDNLSWQYVANSTRKDTLARVFNGQPLYYRLQTVCPNTGDTTNSAGRLVNVKPTYKCYCYSQSDGGVSDTSDVGGIDFAGVHTYNGGPHVLNGAAVKRRTDYTDRAPIEVKKDSTYSMVVYHTMSSSLHGDGKITVFMDYDNDKEYDVSKGERIFTGFTSIGTHTVIDSVRVPHQAIVDVPTGMRVIINNNVAPNNPSDLGCGTYTSGETEDFIVIFRNNFRTSVSEVATSLAGFGVHPNPTNGRFTVQFNTEGSIEQLSLRVTNLTGQEVYNGSYKHVGGLFSEELNIEGQSSGVYFVELEADGQKLIRKIVLQ